VGDSGKIRATGFHGKSNTSYASTGGFTEIDGAGERDQDPTGLQNTPRPRKGIAANQIKNNVDVMHNILESLRGIINNLVGAEIENEFAMLGGGSS